MYEKKPIGFVISNLSKRIKRRADSCAGRQYLDSLTGTNGWIIGYLAHNADREIFQKDIEEVFSVRRSTVSRVVTLMEQKGLIIRESVDDDGRLKRLKLTDKAWEIHKKIDAEMNELDEDISRGLTNEEIETFLRIAEKMSRNIGDDGCHCRERKV